MIRWKNKKKKLMDVEREVKQGNLDRSVSTTHKSKIAQQAVESDKVTENEDVRKMPPFINTKY